ncbi:MAG: Rpn family recombination-promoting nuclease/putative transposase [Prevotella sp.]|nr:Rpn family recombination-promoting nuclease/putative transposase [Prevotella sp.]
MAKYLDPKADLTFKKIFGEHPDLVISLLNALLPFSEEQRITEIEYLPAEMPPEKPLFKNTIVDVRCKAIDGRQFIVEMQMEWTTAFKQRVLFNASKAYVRQLGKSHKYYLLQPVYCLSLVNDIFEPDMPDFYHYYRMVHEEHTEKVIDGLNLVFVELPKFKPQTVSEKKMQVLWLRFLTEIDENTREVPEELLENPDVKRAVEIVEESAYSEAEMYAYDKFWDAIRVEQAFVDEAEIRFNIGIDKGKQDTARKLKSMNVMTIEQIAEATGLTTEQIKAL